MKIREKKLSDGTRSVYLDIYHRGKRSYEFLEIRLTGEKKSDAEKMRLAEIIRARREIDILSDVNALVPVHRGETSLVDFARAIAPTKGAKSALSRTLPYIEEFFAGLRLDAVSEKDCARFQEFLKSRDLKSSSIETYFSALVTVLNAAVRERYLSENPARNVQRVRSEAPVLKSLTREEIDRLLATPFPGDRPTVKQLIGKREYGALGGRLKRAFVFALNTGFRWVDVKNLTYGQIRGRQVEKHQQKTGAAVYVPLNETAWTMVDPGDRRPDPGELVFGIVTETNPDWYLDRWGKAAGLPFALGFHVARHTFARRLLESGVDIATLQRLLGHKTIKQTMRYAMASNQALVDAVSKLG